METIENSFSSVNKYISGFPEETQQLLETLRQTIKAVAPEAEEVISYSMPSFRMSGMLVWYAAFSKHIDFYPKPSGIEAFRDELSGYERTKRSVRFNLNEPIPFDLIGRIVKFRVQENIEKKKRKSTIDRDKLYR
jgi:uncharacterized protein YdhG (YjbR/CyaY superfamily)